MNHPSIQPAYQHIGESLVRELAKLMGQNGMISLAGGYPGPELFDQEGILEASREALIDAPTACLQYGPTDGLPVLREQIARWMSSRGTPCDPADVMVTSGSQQGFDLVNRTLLSRGQSAVVERPTYTGPLRVLKVAGVHIQTVGGDAHGLDVDELEALLRDPSNARPSLMYVVPTFANPTGATMTLERRLRLLRLAVEYRFVIVEDDPYGDLRFRGEPVPHLLSLLDQVPEARPWLVHLGSFSKVLAPGLRVSWLIAPAPIRGACVLAKQLDDLSNPGLTQMTVAKYLAAGRLEQHLPVFLNAYRERSSAMQTAIDRHLSGRVAFNPVEGGMFMWGRLLDGFNSRDLLALAIEEKVTFVAGDIYDGDRPDTSTLRLSFSTPSTAQIEEGVARIGRAWSRLANSKAQGH